MENLRLNPDLKKRKKVLFELKNNRGYCPCAIEQSEDTLCKCKDARENGNCICGLFVPKR